MTITIAPHGICVHEPSIERFFAKHASNQAVLEACEQQLATFCRFVDDFMVRQQVEPSSDLLGFLASMDKRQEQRMAELAVRLSTIEEAASATSTAVAERVAGQLAGLLQVIHDTASKLDTRSVRDDLLRVVSNAQEASAEQMSKAVTELRAALSDSVVGPLSAAHQQVAEVLAGLPEHVTDAVHSLEVEAQIKTLHDALTTSADALRSQLSQIERDVLQAADGRAKEHEHQRLMCQTTISHKLDSLPLLTKDVLNDVLGKLEQQVTGTGLLLSCVKQELQGMHGELRNNAASVACIAADAERLSTKIDVMAVDRAKSSASINKKGSEGEDRLFDLLTSKLLMRDGYTVERVHGHAASCDICIKRDGAPCIRLENKAHGRDTYEKVRQKEVDKFIRDLVTVGNHGIFVSQHSDIVGVANLELQQLPNGKFAVFMARNNYDVDSIISVVQLLYKLDGIVGSEGEGPKQPGVTLSAEALARIQAYVRDFDSKVRTIKSHMRESIALLNAIQLDMVDRVLQGMSASTETGDIDDPDRPFVCRYCKAAGQDTRYKRKQNLTVHLKERCPHAPADDQPVV